MAFYFGEEDQNQGQNGQTDTNVQTGKDSTVLANGPTGSSASPNNASTNNARSNPGNFVGISQYLDANKPQSAALANKVGGVITGAADPARNELNTKVADTDSQIKANTVGYDQNAINQLNTDAKNADVAKIQSLKNASYQGPSSLGAINSLDAAKQASANADTEEGRRALIGSLYKDQPLKSGALSFDNLLLQAAPEAKDALALAKSKADVGGLQTNVTNESARLQAAAQAAKDTTAQTAAQTRAAIGQAQSGFESGLQQRVDAARRSAVQESQGALDRLQGGGGLTGQASDRDLQMLGINQDQYGQLLSAGPSANLAGNILDPSRINAANVASADDYARYNVLKRLAEGGNFLGDDASQAGTYDSDLLDFNYVAPPVAAPVAPPPPAPKGDVEINAAGENNPNKASILRNPDGTPVLDNGDPMVLSGPAPKASGGKNGSLDKIGIGLSKTFKKFK